MIHDASETEERLPYDAVAESIADVLRLRAAGTTVAPDRTIVPLDEGGTLLAMVAVGAGVGAIKTVTVHPANGAAGLPTIQGELVAFDTRTGRRLGTLDGAAVTRRRTAALSLLAARTLRPGGGAATHAALIVGAGAQGTAHLEALREGLGIERFFVASRSRDSAERLAARARRHGASAHVVERPADALADVDVIVTATTSTVPVLPDEVPDRCLVLAVGAFRADMAELPPALLARSSVVVDTLEGARAEAGDLIQAVAAGAWSWELAVELQDVLAGTETARGDRPTIFKSVGHSLFDLAAARVAFANEGERPPKRRA